MGFGRACGLELEDELLAPASVLLQAPRPSAALRATPATSSFLAESLDGVMVAPRCRSGRCRRHSGRDAETDCAQPIFVRSRGPERCDEPIGFPASNI
jgi:hypothetical protein